MTSRYNNLSIPLNANASFYGLAEETKRYEYDYLQVSLNTDQPCVLYIEFSEDKINFDGLNIYNYSPISGYQSYELKTIGKYFRVRLENGPFNQTFIKLISTLKRATVNNIEVKLDSDNDSVSIGGTVDISGNVFVSGGNVSISDGSFSNISSNIAQLNANYGNTVVNFNYNRAIEYDTPIPNSSKAVLTPANTPAFADSTVLPTTKPLKYKGIDGLYLQKPSANSNKFNIYYYNGYNESNRPVSTLTSLFAELTNFNALNSFFITVYTKPTGVNDYLNLFAHSAFVYTINASVSQAKQLLYWGVPPVNKSNLPLIPLIYNPTASKGELNPSEPIAFITFQSDSAATPFEISLSKLGYSFNNLNQTIECKSYEEFQASYLDIQNLNLDTGNVVVINTANTNVLNTVDISGNVAITNNEIAITNPDISAINLKITTDNPNAMEGYSGNVFVKDIQAGTILTDINNKIDNLTSVVDGSNVFSRISGLHNTSWIPVKVSNTGVLDVDASLSAAIDSNISVLFGLNQYITKTTTTTLVCLDNITLNASLVSSSTDLSSGGIDISKPLTVSFTTSTTTSGSGIFLQGSNDNINWWVLEPLHQWSVSNQQQKAWHYNGLGVRYLRIRNPTVNQLLNVSLAVLGYAI